jgi:hypothetical protein
MSNDEKYRYNKEDILAKGPELLDLIYSNNSDSVFWREAWAFIFELRVDLEAAMDANDKERQLLYLNGIKATSNMVKNVHEIFQLSQIITEKPNESS